MVDHLQPFATLEDWVKLFEKAKSEPEILALLSILDGIRIRKTPFERNISYESSATYDQSFGILLHISVASKKYSLGVRKAAFNQLSARFIKFDASHLVEHLFDNNNRALGNLFKVVDGNLVHQDLLSANTDLQEIVFNHYVSRKFNKPALQRLNKLMLAWNRSVYVQLWKDRFKQLKPEPGSVLV